MLHRTHLNGSGFAEDSVNNTSNPGGGGTGRSRSPAGQPTQSVTLDKMDKNDGVKERAVKRRRHE
jgi:hypothetical protein